MAGVQAIHAEVLRGRVFVALHMHAGDGNVHTNIPVNSDDYEMLRTANEAVAHIMRFAKELGGVVSGEHGIGITKLEFLEKERDRGLRGVEGEGRPRGPLQPRQAPRGRRPLQRLYALLRPHRARVDHPREERHRVDRGLGEGLPALRQVQARVLHPRAAREPPLQPAEQDPRPVAAHRGLPLRGADAPRREPEALRRVRRRGRPLHRLPQVRVAVPGGHRFRQRLHRDARPAREARQEALQPRLGPRDGLPERDRPGDDQGAEDADARLGLQGAAPRARASRGASW